MINKTNPLLIYHYRGINNCGQKTLGHIEAQSLTMAKVRLRQQGIIVKKIALKKQGLLALLRIGKKISSHDITLISRQLATLIDSGIPLVQSFTIMAQGQVNARLKNLLHLIKKDLENGSTLTESLQKHPSYFNNFFCSLIEAGEKSGTLDIMLSKIAAYKEKIERLKKNIKKALTYPLLVLFIAFLVSAGLLLFIVPQFESLFAGFGAELPGLTKAIVNLSKHTQSNWYIILAFLVSLFCAFFYAKNHSVKGPLIIDKLLLTLPISGSILKKASIARFARTLSIVFTAGIPLFEALKSVTGTTGNSIYARAIEQIIETLAAGHPLNNAIKNTALFPDLVVQMVAIGEETGVLEKMLTKIADFYEEEVDNSIEILANLLEPVIMAILGILIGGLVIAMYLPVFTLGTIV